MLTSKVLCILFLVSIANASFEFDRKPRSCPRVRVARPEWLFGEWSDWSPCSKTCGGGGLQHRRRQCSDANPGCQTSETRSCGHRPCAPGWSEWCEWEGCRATCGVGERMRIRFCEGGTLRCPGKDFQVSRCNAGVPCPGWYDWSEWSPCSQTCGMGVQHRERNCFDEYECHGNRTETRLCNEGPCNRYYHGQYLQYGQYEWSAWSQWSSCDRPCGGGTMHRRRQCYPSREYCPGHDSERQRCNDHPCHHHHYHLFHPQQQHVISSDMCVWTTWSGWSGCSPLPNYTCDDQDVGRGQRWRQRYCVRTDVRSECDRGFECTGGSSGSQQRETCALDPRADPCRRG